MRLSKVSTYFSNIRPTLLSLLGGILGSLLLTTSAESAIFRVVIDPGHGGTDEGTVYNDGQTRIAEKDITLTLAKKVAHQLRTQGLLVTLTRNEDQDISLPARTALANHLGADVFISIHMNSTETTNQTDAEGIETFILNNATDASSKRLAHLENSVISTTPTDSPENMDVALILKDLRLDANLSESKRLACNIQENLVSATNILIKNRHSDRLKRNRGIKQALFHVLLGADMPSVLVESGFLSSSTDRSLVLSKRGQERISHAIAEAIREYKDGHKKLKPHVKRSSALNKCKVN